MGVDPSLGGLEREILKLEETFQAEIFAAKRASRTAVISSSALGGLVVVFLLVNFYYFRTEWTSEKFSTSLEREVNELTPRAREELSRLGQELVPVFVNEARTQFDKERPRIFARLESDLDKLVDNVLSRQQRRLVEIQDRVLANTQKSLHAAYPSFADASRRDELERNFRTSAETAVAQAINTFHDRFGSDVERLKKTVLKFDVRDTHENSADLQKKFLHLWLQLLDEEIAGI